MRLETQAMLRAAQLAEQRRAAFAGRIAARCDGVPGVRAEVSGEGVELVGHGLLRRWLNDARLRFAGSGR